MHVELPQHLSIGDLHLPHCSYLILKRVLLQTSTAAQVVMASCY